MYRLTRKQTDEMLATIMAAVLHADNMVETLKHSDLIVDNQAAGKWINFRSHLISAINEIT